MYSPLSLESTPAISSITNPKSETVFRRHQFKYNIMILFKVRVHHLKKIGGCIDGNYFSELVLFFFSPRCLEPLGLTKNLQEIRIFPFHPQVFIHININI